MTIHKGDFITLEFTGKITGTGEVFDTTNIEEAKKANLPTKEVKPLTISIGHGMLPEGLDTDIEGKEEGTTHTIELEPAQAFGERDRKLIQMVPTKLFHAQKIVPERGMQLSLEGRIVRVLSTDRGRTLVDLNGPLAGKKVTYTYTITKKIEDEKEKINALQDFLFRKRFEHEKKEGKLVFKTEKGQEPFIQLFAPKFKEILGVDIINETKEPAQKKETPTPTEEKHP